MAFWDFLKKKQPQITSKPKKENLGASWNSPYGSRPVFPSRDALEAYGEHAYLFATVTRCTEDLAALPLRLIQGKGKNAKVITEHPVLDLLENPSTTMDGYLFRQQICLDLLLNGTFFVLLVGVGKLPASLIRLHPDETQFVTDDIVGIRAIKNSSYGKEVLYDVAKVVFGRTASYAKGPKGLYGTSPVQSLYEELKSDHNAMQLASLASAQGRPDCIIYPSDASDVWPKEVREEIISSYNKMAKRGGAIALSGMAKIETLNLSPREMEYEKARVLARQSISAVMGVPGTINGLPDANYATSLNQRKGYWHNQKHRAKRLDIAYTKIARLWNSNLRIEHDFSGIDALSDRDDKLARIKMHIAHGMEPNEAYVYEGLDDAPQLMESFRAVIDEEEKPAEEKKNSAFVKALIETDRQALWEKWIETKQAPAENKLLSGSASFLSDLKKLVLKKYDEQNKAFGGVLTKANRPTLTKSEIEELVRKNLERDYVEIYEQEYQSENNRLRKLLGLAVVTVAIAKTRPLGFLRQLGSRIYDSTVNALNRFFDKVDYSKPSDEIKKDLSGIGALQESRSQTIARTEATKIVNSAGIDAAGDLEEQEPTIKFVKEWITERDDRVREAHEALDTQAVDVYELFVVPSGEFSGFETNWPTGFGVAELDINCRCGTITRPEYK